MPARAVDVARGGAQRAGGLKMGTSSLHRSPSTPQWERVRELYRRHDPDPSEVLSRIVTAFDQPTRSGLSDMAVTCCLDRLLYGSEAAAEGRLAALLAPGHSLGASAGVLCASGVRDAADRLIAGRGVSSRYGDIALQALGSSVLELAGQVAKRANPQPDLAELQSHLADYHTGQRLHRLTSTFLTHDFAHTFRYFVARDIPQFVGTEALPTVADSVQLQDRIESTCRRVTGGVDLGDTETDTHGALEQPDPKQRTRLLHVVLHDAVDRGLSALASAGE